MPASWLSFVFGIPSLQRIFASSSYNQRPGEGEEPLDSELYHHCIPAEHALSLLLDMSKHDAKDDRSGTLQSSLRGGRRHVPGSGRAFVPPIRNRGTRQSGVRLPPPPVQASSGPFSSSMRRQVILSSGAASSHVFTQPQVQILAQAANDIADCLNKAGAEGPVLFIGDSPS